MNKHHAFSFFLIFCLLFFSYAAESTASDSAPVGQYEVRVFTHRDYVGDSQSYILNTRTHRILLVNRFPEKFDNAISSLHLGSEVYAILFDYHDFHISLGQKSGGNWFSGLVNALVDIHKKMTPLGYMGQNKQSAPPSQISGELWGQINVGVYTSSSPMVLHNDRYTSMLVIPKDLDTAYGVALYNTGDNFIRVEPIPDEIRFTERRIPDFGSYLNDKISIVAFLGPRIQNTHLTLYDKTNYAGQAITLPGVSSDKITFYLADYQFAGRARSIRLGITPVKADSVRVAAPAADSATVQEILKVMPIPVMTVMAEAAPVKPAQTGAAAPAQTKPPKQEKPATQGQASGWAQKAPPEPQPPEPHETRPGDRPPEPETDRHRPGEREGHTGWEGDHPPPPHEELPPGIGDLRGRWRDNHGNFFEIIQHGFDFILLGDGVPIHGAGIQLEGGRITLLVNSEESGIMRLEGQLERGGDREPVQRIVLDKRIILERD